MRLACSHLDDRDRSAASIGVLLPLVEKVNDRAEHLVSYPCLDEFSDATFPTDRSREVPLRHIARERLPRVSPLSGLFELPQSRSCSHASSLPSQCDRSRSELAAESPGQARLFDLATWPESPAARALSLLQPKLFHSSWALAFSLSTAEAVDLEPAHSMHLPIAVATGAPEAYPPSRPRRALQPAVFSDRGVAALPATVVPGGSIIYLLCKQRKLLFSTTLNSARVKIHRIDVCNLFLSIVKDESTRRTR